MKLFHLFFLLFLTFPSSSAFSAANLEEVMTEFRSRYQDFSPTTLCELRPGMIYEAFYGPFGSSQFHAFVIESEDGPLIVEGEVLVTDRVYITPPLKGEAGTFKVPFDRVKLFTGKPIDACGKYIERAGDSRSGQPD